MADEKKQNVYSVEGELVSELDRSKSYFETSGAIIKKLLDFKYKIKTEVEKADGKDKKVEKGEEEILVFEDVGGCKIEAKKFTVAVKVAPRIVKSNFKAVERWNLIREVGIELEKYQGIGPEGQKDEKQSEREKKGIVDIEKFTNFDRKSFES